MSKSQVIINGAKNRPDREEDSLEAATADVKALLNRVKALSTIDSSQISGILSILDEIKSRLLCPSPSQSPARDENQKLRKELWATNAARKSLEKMFSSLGKEKEIMAGELARKAAELDELEELVEDLRTQNERLLAKVQSLTTDRKTNSIDGVVSSGNKVVLQERNKVLSDQLLKSIEGYRSTKRKLKEAQESNAELKIRATAYEEIVGRISSKGEGEIRDVVEEIERICRRVEAAEKEARKEAVAS